MNWRELFQQLTPEQRREPWLAAPALIALALALPLWAAAFGGN